MKSISRRQLLWQSAGPAAARFATQECLAAPAGMYLDAGRGHPVPQDPQIMRVRATIGPAGEAIYQETGMPVLHLPVDTGNKNRHLRPREAGEKIDAVPRVLIHEAVRVDLG